MTTYRDAVPPEAMPQPAPRTARGTRDSSAHSDTRHPRPVLKVTVLGNSQAVWVAPRRSSRGDATYGEHLESLLAHQGIECRVTNLGRWNECLPKALCQFDRVVRAGAPDVVVLQYGAGEAFPAAFPLRVHDYLHTWHVHSGFGRTRARDLLRRILWKRLRTWQRLVASVGGQATHHVGPRRFEAELKKLLADIVREQQALVLVVGIPRPTPELEVLVPGLRRRFERFNEIMRRTCHGAPGTVRFIDCFALEDDPDLVPDGLHLSAAAHAIVAGWLEEAILEWMPASGADYRRPGRR